MSNRTNGNKRLDALAQMEAISAQMAQETRATLAVISGHTASINRVTARLAVNTTLAAAGYLAAPDMVNGILCGRVIAHRP